MNEPKDPNILRPTWQDSDSDGDTLLDHLDANLPPSYDAWIVVDADVIVVSDSEDPVHYTKRYPNTLRDAFVALSDAWSQHMKENG